MNRLGRFIFPYAIFMVLMVVVPLLILGGKVFWDAEGHFTLEYIKYLGSQEVRNTFLFSFGVALRTTVLCLLLAYPAGYFISRRKFGISEQILLFMILPMAVNMLLYTFSMLAVFDIAGIPLGNWALYIGLVTNYLPFVIQPIANCLKQIDESYEEASADLGAGRVTTFLRVILPLSMPGIVGGVSMVLLPSLSSFAISELLTMNKVRLFGSIIENSFNIGMIGYGAVMALMMFALIIVTELIGNDD